MNLETYITNFDASSVIESVLKANNVEPDDNHMKVHMQYIRTKLDSLKKAYKSKDYFKDFPILDTDYASYVIVTNTPFVEEAKREKFKTFMNAKITAKFQDRIKEYIFPYTDRDKEHMKDGLVILRFDSYEEAKLAASAMNGVNIDKTHKVNAVTFLDYERVINMEDNFDESRLISLKDLIKWEENNLTEYLMIKTRTKIHVGVIHYLKKEFQILYTLDNSTISEVEWSPQGKYLVTNEGKSLSFFSGDKNSFGKSFDINVNVKEFNISNNERFAITFSGYNESSASKENVFIWDILRNELIRGLAINKEEKFENFKWSNNNQFLGRLKKDLLIVYESPKMQMLLDTELNARHPIKDNIKDFYWFPNRSNIIAVSEKRTGAKLSETILQFFEIPSRRTFAASSLVGLEIASLQWHKNNTLLAILCKSPEKNPKWAVRIFQFDNNKLSYKSAHTALASEGVSYYSMTIKWMGNDLFVSAKFKENNLDTLSVFPYKVDKQTLKIVSWPLDKFIKNVKHSHFLPSSNGVHFLLACMDPSNSNNYGKVELYAVFDNSLNYCRTFEFTGSLENVKWDHSGRLFEVELSRKKDNEGLRFFDCEGNLVYDYADNTALNAVWRIRHIPILDRASEEEDINKNIKSVFKTYDEEDAEFLSEIDKVNRTQAKMMKNAFMSVIMKRRKAWEENSEEREKMHKVTPPVYLEHEFYIEEILKTEEITIEGNRNDF